MRTIYVSAILGLLLTTGMWLNLFSQQSPIPHSGAQTPETQVISTLLPTGTQQVVLVDSRNQTMAVYHIEPQQGKIFLRSIRSLHWDLMTQEFNATDPEPSKMRLLKP